MSQNTFAQKFGLLATKFSRNLASYLSKVFKKYELWPWSLLLLLGVLVYWPMFRNGFVWDDVQFIVKNRAIHTLWPPIYLWGSRGTGFTWLGQRPMTALSLALDYALWRGNAWGFHLANLLLHLVCTLCTALLARVLFKSRVAAFMAGALFAVHPGHGEAVVAFLGRSDLLASAFVLAATLTYWRSGERTGSCLFYWASLAGFTLACLSKETGLVFLGVLVLLEGVRVKEKQTSWRSAFLRTIPFLVVLGLYGLYRFLVLSGVPPDRGGWNTNLLLLVYGLVGAFAEYLRLLFFPLRLSPWYEFSLQSSFPDVQVLLGALTGVLCIVIFILGWKRSPKGVFPLGWFLVSLAPVLLGWVLPLLGIRGLGGLPGPVVAERWLYMPSIGVCLGGGWIAATFLDGARPAVKILAFLLSVVLIFLLGWRQMSWVPVWRSEESIARAIVASAPKSALGYNNLGHALADRGELDEAEKAYREAIRLMPAYAEAHNNLGLALADHGEMGEAVNEYREAIRLRPSYADAYNNFGIVLSQQGKLDEAAKEFHEAIRLRSDYADAHNNLGIVLGQQGKLDEAVREYQEAIRSDPEMAEPHKNLGVVLGLQGKPEQAEAAYRHALRLDSSLPEAHFALGMVLAERGQLDQAEAEYREAIRLKPDYSQAYFNLGSVLGQQGKPDQMELALREAIRLDPDFFEAHNNLGNNLAKRGKLQEAEVEFREAIRLEPGSFEGHNNLGNALAKQGKYPEAEAEFKEAVRLAPDVPGAYYNLAVAFIRQGRKAEAVKALAAFLARGGQPRSQTEDLIRNLKAH